MAGTSSNSRRGRPTRRPPSRHAPAAPPELRDAGLSARKSLGQHFLTDTNALQRIVDAAELSSDDPVIEIGAGLGGLTEALAARARRVVAIELDAALAERLRQRFVGTNVTVLEADALEVEPAQALSQARARPPYAVVGNLPYFIGQPLLRHYLEAEPGPHRLVVMVQAEVAESIVSRPPNATLLGVSVQLYGQPRLLFRVPPSAFYPPPKVSSAVVRIDVAPAPRADVRDIDAFFRIVRAGFSTKRKQLRNALANGLRIDASTTAELLAAAQIEPTLRAQALTIEQWSAITHAWLERGPAEGER